MTTTPNPTGFVIEPMIITVAGERKEYATGLTVEQLILAEQVEMPEYVTVTLNDEFLPTADRATRARKDGDNVEFLYLMGGGQ